MAIDDPLLDRATIVELLDRVADEANHRGVTISMFLVGGGAMALAYDNHRSTRDLDGVFEPKSVVDEIAAAVAEQSDLDLAPDWLNDAAKAFMPGNDPEATTFYDTPGLSVRVASPRYLFVMKAMAARELDEDDLRLLFSLATFRTASEALDAVRHAYPTQLIKPAVQYMVESIAAEHGADGDAIAGSST